MVLMEGFPKHATIVAVPGHGGIIH
jgi:hypothetical protein